MHEGKNHITGMQTTYFLIFICLRLVNNNSNHILIALLLSGEDIKQTKSVRDFTEIWKGVKREVSDKFSHSSSFFESGSVKKMP